MAEALCRETCGDHFESHSAGMKPTAVNPVAIDVMFEIGLDISRQRSKSLFEFMSSNAKFDYVITLCDEAKGQKCPNVPGGAEYLRWSFPDPAAVEGTRGEQLQRTRQVRDAIKQKLTNWCAEMCVTESA